jgi:hypothetical protein
MVTRNPAPMSIARRRARRVGRIEIAIGIDEVGGGSPASGTDEDAAILNSPRDHPSPNT